MAYGLVDSVVTVYNPKKRLAAPSVKSLSFNYTGGKKTITNSGFNSDLMKCTGTTEATEPGTYTFKYELLDPSNYCWNDYTTTPKIFTWTIIPKTVVAIPSFSQVSGDVGIVSVRYAGKNVSPTVYNYNSTLVNQSGNTAEAIGTYTTTWSLKDTENCCWEDGTTDPKSKEWEIVSYTINSTVIIQTYPNWKMVLTREDTGTTQEYTADSTGALRIPITESAKYTITRSTSNTNYIYYKVASGSVSSYTVKATGGKYSAKMVFVPTHVASAKPSVVVNSTTNKNEIDIVIGTASTVPVTAKAQVVVYDADKNILVNTVFAALTALNLSSGKYGFIVTSTSIDTSSAHYTVNLRWGVNINRRAYTTTPFTFTT